MKIDKKKPAHWIYLIFFSINVLLSILLRPFINSSKKIVILYGHKLNGNLKAIYDYAQSQDTGISILYLTLDPVYFRKLKKQRIHCLSAINPTTIRFLSKTDLIISDHGLHALIFFLKLTDTKFVDVWHGIPFKGFNSDDFKTQQQYQEIWVTSEFMKELYTTKFGFNPSKVIPIGYPRTDLLINNNSNTNEIYNYLNITDQTKNVLLYAPTWQQDNAKRTIFPFESEENEFFEQLNQISEKTNSICIIRTHLNYKLTPKQQYTNLIFLDAETYPNTEEILLISDVLICDWSSICFDYLLLERPTIFLNTPPPFAKGMSLDESYRFGIIVDSISNLIDSINLCIVSQGAYQMKHSSKASSARSCLYDNNADGHSTARAYDRITTLIS